MGKSGRKRPEIQEVDALTVQRMLPVAAMFGELRELVIHAGLRAVEMMLEAKRTATSTSWPRPMLGTPRNPPLRLTPGN